MVRKHHKQLRTTTSTHLRMEYNHNLGATDTAEVGFPVTSQATVTVIIISIMIMFLNLFMETKLLPF